MTIVSEKQEMARREEALPSPATGDLTEVDSQAPLVADGFVLPGLDVPEDAPPAYGEHRDRLQFNQPGFEAGATVTGQYHSFATVIRLSDWVSSS